VRAGEFVTLLGPSGCGKTTLLRLIAGFDGPDAGRVLIEGHDYTRAPAHKRPVNTVFQRYMMFPHLSVFENVAFGLRVARVPRSEVGERVREALALVRLSGFESRAADQLSGGQAQRISLARALVNRPRILLLDEPLSALDLQVRFDMQAELRRIHREVGTTFIYVTHDQQEAMSLSDRVVVFNDGQIEQVGAPDEVYHRPGTRFVAAFVGEANVLAATVTSRNGSSSSLRLGSAGPEVVVEDAVGAEEGWIVMRPETLRLTTGEQGPLLPGRVVDVAFLGASVAYRVEVGSGVDRVIVRVHEVGARNGRAFALGDHVQIAYDPSGCRFLGVS
jgi:spermidine/putrescine transport system ATP-binding protein